MANALCDISNHVGNGHLGGDVGVVKNFDAFCFFPSATSDVFVIVLHGVIEVCECASL